MRRMRSLLLCTCIVVSSAGLYLTHASASAMGSPASSPWKIDSLRIQTHNVSDPTGAHDLGAVIPANQYVYIEQYVRILRPIPASPDREELWILTGSTPDRANKVLYHHVASLSLPSEKPGNLIWIKITHVRIGLTSTALTLPVLIRSRLSYAGSTKQKEVVAFVCDLKKIHCHL